MVKSPSEDTRVKLPALFHCTRLGYNYISLKDYLKEGKLIDQDTNIFLDIFKESISHINNTDYDEASAKLLLEFLSQSLGTQTVVNKISDSLDNEDLGRKFYNFLIDGIEVDGYPNKIKLIDFENPDNNTYNVVTELTYQKHDCDDNFRPDITLLINGIPLVFIEVKKPNNKEGMIAEYNRMIKRQQNKTFRKFINITQLMIFSNNMEYEDDDLDNLFGAFYATASYSKPFFNHFREEDEDFKHEPSPAFAALSTDFDPTEDLILKDNNHPEIKTQSYYLKDREPFTPTNRILTSLCNRERLLFILQYGLAYVERTDKNGIKHLEKHIMRYPQMFATKAIHKRIEDARIQQIPQVKGIIWHTQGSGKTALAYFVTKFLKDYYAKLHKPVRFFFIVDRLDLMTQAKNEFIARGLSVDLVNSKNEFVSNISKVSKSVNGQDTITVVNIQKFSEESVATANDYDIDVQRVYFMDEAHRSYNPTGSFLANLFNSDKNAVLIALTGTPLLNAKTTDATASKKTVHFNSKDIFGGYIHKYWYNNSIKDGYTVRLIREAIETSYKTKLRSVLDELETIKGSIQKKDLFAHPKYVAPLTEYIVGDFLKSKIALGDDTIGAMIVADSSEQAKAIYEELQNYKTITKALILHDVDDKETREQERDDFKAGKIDFLVVYNMLLTGFDAPRLKKMYLGRVVKDHSLLQTLTRVNRPYKTFHYGYIVDFADIRKEFDKANQEYYNELKEELGDEFENYSQLFYDAEEIEKRLIEIKDILFDYDTSDIEAFSQSIGVLDKPELTKIRQALEDYKVLYNVARLQGFDEITQKIDINTVKSLASEVERIIFNKNFSSSLVDSADTQALLNTALDEIKFSFIKIGEEELTIADKWQETAEKTRKAFTRNLDPKDPEYISLFEELKRVMAKKNIEELTADDMQQSIKELEELKKKIDQKNQKDQTLCNKYNGDAKFMRIHKRMKETPPPLIPSDTLLQQILLNIKYKTDNLLLTNSNVINNEAYFDGQLKAFVIPELQQQKVTFTLPQVVNMTKLIENEYFAEMVI
ncbi:MAG: type I restriction endonuclease [Treponema sp.]|nr:type I restriction endonuclease [Treponema sp.]